MKKPRIINLSLNPRGFTIVETLLATAIFSLMLLILITVVIQITRTYYGGVVLSTVNNTALTAVNDIAQAIQTSDGNISLPTNGSLRIGQDYFSFCVDSQRYNYQIGDEVEAIPAATPKNPPYQAFHALTVDYAANCTGPSNHGKDNGFDVFNSRNSHNTRDLIGPNMRLANISIVQETDLLYKIEVRVVYGDYESLCSPGDCPNGPATAADLTSPNLSCQEGVSEEFCAVSDISTYVENRVQ